MRSATCASVFTLLALLAVARATETSVPFIGADYVHYVMHVWGRGVTVAVIDTGVDLSDWALANDIAPGGDSFINGIPVHDGGSDVYNAGHGTFVSLIITDDWMGVSPGARVLPIRITGSDGGWDVQDLVKAVKYVIQRHRADPTIRVINISLGMDIFYCSCDGVSDVTQRLAEAVTDALNEGIVTIVGTGNDAACDDVDFPACLGDVLAVAADYDGSYGTVEFESAGCTDYWPSAYWVSCFSNVADCPQLLAAPGYDITVGRFEHAWGTSYAAAHCSGVAALMFSKNACGNLSAYDARSTLWSQATVHNWAYPWCAISFRPPHLNAITAVTAVAGPTCASLGDLDCDGLVSGYDFQRFEGCMSGPVAGYPDLSCACTDFPESPPDGDVDLRDLYYLQLSTGPMGSGACCHADGSCSITTIYDCLAENGSTYKGHGTTCDGIDCIVGKPGGNEPFARGGTITMQLDSTAAGQMVQPGATVDWTIRAEVSSAGNSGLAQLSTNLVQDASNPAHFDIPPATTIGPQMAPLDRPAGISNPGPTGSAFGGTQSGTPGARNLRQIGGCQNTFGLPGVDAGVETEVTPGIGQGGQAVVAAGSFTAPSNAGAYTFRLQSALATLLNSVSPPSPPDYWPVTAATIDLSGASFSFTVQGTILGDMNCDGLVNSQDIDGFIDALFGDADAYDAYLHSFPVYHPCNMLNGDFSGDGVVNAQDIDGFAAALFGG